MVSPRQDHRGRISSTSDKSDLIALSNEVRGYG
jgi:hypothetical protein